MSDDDIKAGDYIKIYFTENDCIEGHLINSHNNQLKIKNYDLGKVYSIKLDCPTLKWIERDI